jgi:hypothetical protein
VGRPRQSPVRRRRRDRSPPAPGRPILSGSMRRDEHKNVGASRRPASAPGDDSSVLDIPRSCPSAAGRNTSSARACSVPRLRHDRLGSVRIAPGGDIGRADRRRRGVAATNWLSDLDLSTTPTGRRTVAGHPMGVGCRTRSATRSASQPTAPRGPAAALLSTGDRNRSWVAARRDRLRAATPRIGASGPRGRGLLPHDGDRRECSLVRAVRVLDRSRVPPHTDLAESVGDVARAETRTSELVNKTTRLAPSRSDHDPALYV